MRDLVIVFSAIGLLFYITALIMEYKAKNYIYEKYNILLNLMMFVSIYSVGGVYKYKYSGSYSSFINVIIAIAILGGYVIFQKNRIYLFKGIDKKFIRENKREIIQIIENYKNNYTAANSEITLVNNKVVFEKVNKEQTEECLSLIGNFLDENRKEYTSKDYFNYYIKAQMIPLTIIIVAIYLLFRAVTHI